MFDLTGKTALVTGATGGIGGAIARAFHKQGATVALSGTRREVLDTIAGELKERVHVLTCNLSNIEEVEALVPSAEKAMGQLDILDLPMPASPATICSCRLKRRGLGTTSSTSI